MIMKTVFALFLIAHGLVHLLWFVVPWQITEVDGLPYSTTILGGRLDLGAGGIRFYGLLWIVPTAIFVLAGIGLLFSAPWWWTLTLVAAAISFLLCILGLPVAKWGALIDVLIAAVLLLGNQYGLAFLPFPAVT